MLSSTRFWFFLALIVVIVLGVRARDPLRTALPWDVDDLSAIQPQLDRLTPADRELVLDYLKRSNGDVLPAALADPDAPFTARTFAEAIELQKDFLAKDAVRQSAADARNDAREAAREPLRQALTVYLVRREILQGAAIYGGPLNQPVDKGRAAAPAQNGNQVLVVTYRLHNHGSSDIAAAKGQALVVDASGTKRSECWIEHAQALTVASFAEVRCGNLAWDATPADREFVALPASALTLIWNPTEVFFADGRILRSAD